MIYGIGTGRCGTKSLAVQMGGVHEPKPSIAEDAIDYYETGKKSTGLMSKLDVRKDLFVGVISDNKQSLVIDLICEIDKDARFIWLIRDLDECISSFLKRGLYNEFKETRRIEPKGGFHKGCSEKEKLIWYYFAMNYEIANKLHKCNAPFRIIKTEELKEKENCSCV